MTNSINHRGCFSLVLCHCSSPFPVIEQSRPALAAWPELGLDPYRCPRRLHVTLPAALPGLWVGRLLCRTRRRDHPPPPPRAPPSPSLHGPVPAHGPRAAAASRSRDGCVARSGPAGRDRRTPQNATSRRQRRRHSENADKSWSYWVPETEGYRHWTSSATRCLSCPGENHPLPLPPSGRWIMDATETRNASTVSWCNLGSGNWVGGILWLPTCCTCNIPSTANTRLLGFHIVHFHSYSRAIYSPTDTNAPLMKCIVKTMKVHLLTATHQNMTHVSTHVHGNW